MSPLHKVEHLNELGSFLLAQLQVNHIAQCSNPDVEEMVCLVFEESAMLAKIEDCDELIDHYNRLDNLGIMWDS